MHWWYSLLEVHDDSIMSYLIGLYVYYHGNNLQYFGFYKTDIYEGVELNQGINRPDLRSILPSEVVDRMEKDKEIEKELNYEQIFRDALHESQEQSKNLAKSKIMKSDNYFNNTERYILEDDDTESLDLGIFDSLNGFWIEVNDDKHNNRKRH